MELYVEEWTEKKLKIVETTIAEIANQGFEHVTTAKIARAAGVGEGTIYRHFQSKDELIDVSAEYAGQAISRTIRENYQPKAPVEEQFYRFCYDFLESGRKHKEHHGYLNYYMDSPQGLAYRKKMVVQVGKDPTAARPLFFPLNLILAQAKQEQQLKDLPLQLHALMTISTLVFIVRDAALGLLILNNELRSSIATACWDGVRK